MTKRAVYFNVTGDFVTKTSREWLFSENRSYKKVMEFLMRCMAGSSLNEKELRNLAEDVLLGKRKFIGTTADDSYGLVPDNFDVIREYAYSLKNISHMKNKAFETRIAEEYKKKNRYGAYEYGWLSPEGKFYEVPWAKHEIFAQEYIEKYYQRYEPYAGDFLISQKWILMHSPTQQKVKLDDYVIETATKRQKEFLYDYFMARGMTEKANSLFGLNTNKEESK